MKVSDVMNPRLVLVTWIDITEHTHWSEDVPNECLEVQTAGWLLRQGDETITMVGSLIIDDDGSQANNALVIPNACIRKIKDLQQVEQE